MDTPTAVLGGRLRTSVDFLHCQLLDPCAPIFALHTKDTALACTLQFTVTIMEMDAHAAPGALEVRVWECLCEHRAAR